MGQAIPEFWFGLILILIFYSWLDNPFTGEPLLPAGGMSTLGENFSIWDRIKHLILPEMSQPQSDLFPLHPLPVATLKNPKFESLFKFPYFNSIQTQVFHTVFHTGKNILLGAPTGTLFFE